jgi:hypothetical protein
MLLLLLSPVFSGWCYILAKKAGLKSTPWLVAGALVGPIALPLFHNHKRLALRKALGHGLVWFRP